MKKLNNKEHELVTICFANGLNPQQVWMMAKDYYNKKKVEKK